LLVSVIPRLHDLANIEQTSRKRPANIQQTYRGKYEACIIPRLHDQAGSTSWLDELAIC